MYSTVPLFFSIFCSDQKCLVLRIEMYAHEMVRERKHWWTLRRTTTIKKNSHKIWHQGTRRTTTKKFESMETWQGTSDESNGSQWVPHTYMAYSRLISQSAAYAPFCHNKRESDLDRWQCTVSMARCRLRISIERKRDDEWAGWMTVAGAMAGRCRCAADWMGGGEGGREMQLKCSGIAQSVHAWIEMRSEWRLGSLFAWFCVAFENIQGICSMCLNWMC